MLQYYLEKLNYLKMPEFLVKYLDAPCLIRLKKVSYLCGMDYASKDIYNIEEFISRFDHSLAVALMTWKLTESKEATLAALIHDISTPCFSHVVDFMNGDYENQESTEEFTEHILRNDEYFMSCLECDNINLADIVNFKRYTIVDNDRPKLCADRLDGIISTGISWTNNISRSDIDSIVDDMCVVKNEDDEDEIGFKTIAIAEKVLEVSKSIDMYCHTVENIYLMELLANITKMAIDRKYVRYEDLFLLNDDEMLGLFRGTGDIELIGLLNKFETVTMAKISKIEMPNVKIRKLNPIVNGRRLLN